MAVHIRLKRTGTTNLPSFRVVVADSRSPRDGRNLEEIGFYDPKKAGENFSVDLERARFWLARGAQPSETVHSLLKKAELKASSAKGLPAETLAGAQATPETQNDTKGLPA